MTGDGSQICQDIELVSLLDALLDTAPYKTLPDFNLVKRHEYINSAKKNESIIYIIDSSIYMVAGAGFEPTTFGL